MGCIAFEVGRTYRILSSKRLGQFRAKCVSRTAKTATFEASESGARLYMAKFTLRAGRMSLNTYFDDLPMEVFVSNKGTNRFPYGVFAYACDAID